MVRVARAGALQITLLLSACAYALRCHAGALQVSLHLLHGVRLLLTQDDVQRGPRTVRPRAAATWCVQRVDVEHELVASMAQRDAILVPQDVDALPEPASIGLSDDGPGDGGVIHGRHDLSDPEDGRHCEGGSYEPGIKRQPSAWAE